MSNEPLNTGLFNIINQLKEHPTQDGFAHPSIPEVESLLSSLEYRGRVDLLESSCLRPFLYDFIKVASTTDIPVHVGTQLFLFGIKHKDAAIRDVAIQLAEKLELTNTLPLLLSYVDPDQEYITAYETRWLWKYNNERPNLALGGITPSMKLAMAA